MTSTQIRYTLTGIKSEIARETERDRIVHLCEMGLYWSEQLRTYEYPDWCDTCGRQKPIDDFEVMKGYRLHTCKLCWNRKRYSYRKKKLENVLK